MMMNETFEAVLVTVVALAALLVLIRQYLPEPPSARGRSAAPGCANCASSHHQPPAPRAATINPNRAPRRA
jgi:hypothetical protein